MRILGRNIGVRSNALFINWVALIIANELGIGILGSDVGCFAMGKSLEEGQSFPITLETGQTVPHNRRFKRHSNFGQHRLHTIEFFHASPLAFDRANNPLM